MSWNTGRYAQLSLLLVLLAALPGRAQSLAELSRQERAKKAAKTTKEFTNDNIPAVTLAGAPSTEEAKPGDGKAADGKAADGKPGEAGKEAAKPEDVEKEYRAKAAQLKETVEFEERRLDVLQRDLNLTQQQFYSDPNVALKEQYAREDINKRTAEIEAQKAAVEKAKQAITDLEDELRKKSLPAGWAR